jgi:DNA primase
MALKKENSSWKGCCPFHNERTPSFSVKAGSNYFNCFGCGKSGDVITFVSLFDNLTMSMAAKKLATKYGIPIPTGADQDQDGQHSIQTTLRLVAEHFTKRFNDKGIGRKAKLYLIERGFTKEQANILKDWGYGFCDARSLDELAKQMGIAPDSLKNIGLTNEEDKLLFYDRLIFPICDKTGAVIGFGGRTIDENGKPKYINSPETEAYKKGEVLYGLNKAFSAIKQKGRVIATEGYFDVQALHQAGIKESVGICGTALTAQQIFSVPTQTKWVLMMDGDAAGIKATKTHILTLLKNGVSDITVFALPTEHDPYSILQGNDFTWGKEVAAQIKSTHYLDYLDTHRTEEDPTLLETILDTIAQCPAMLAREQVLVALSKHTGFTRAALAESLNQKIREFQLKKLRNY